MTKSQQAEIKKLTKELNSLKRRVNNLEADVEVHNKTLEGDFMRASKNVKKRGRKGILSPSKSKHKAKAKRVKDTSGLFCCTKCKLDDSSSDKWAKKFIGNIRVFKGKNSERNAKQHYALMKAAGKHGHTSKLYDDVLAKKKK